MISCGWTTAWNCRRRFPDLPVYMVPNYVDPKVFAVPVKKFWIAFQPSKRPTEADFIHSMFQAKNPQFRDTPWIELRHMTEAQMARTLGESAVYLSLCRFEACAADHSGSHVVRLRLCGLHGIRARDYTTAQNGCWVPEDDCFECTAQACACRIVTEGGQFFDWMVEQAVHTAGMYKRLRFVSELVSFWKNYPQR